MPFEARVKSVLSGDTVVLSHVTNPTQDRILSLAYVSAPRLRREGDEVCAPSCQLGTSMGDLHPCSGVSRHLELFGDADCPPADRERILN